jgi:hypothetical protein
MQNSEHQLVGRDGGESEPSGPSALHVIPLTGHSPSAQSPRRPTFAFLFDDGCE